MLSYLHCGKIILLSNNTLEIKENESVSGYPSLLNQTRLDSNVHKYTQCVEFGSEHKGPLGASASCNYPETPSMFTSVFIEVSACPLQYSHCSHSVMSPYNRKNMPGHGLVVSVYFTFSSRIDLFKVISQINVPSFLFFFLYLRHHNGNLRTSSRI